MAKEPTPFEVDASGRWFHGTKADLRVGGLLEPGRRSNYGEGRTANHVYFSATLDAATLRGWVGHSPEKLKVMRERLDELKRTGTEKIDD